MVDRVVDEGRIHDDVAVIGQVEVGLAGLQMFQTGVADTVAGMLDGAVYIGLDLFLQLGDRIDTGELAAQACGNQRLEQPAQGPGQSRKTKAGKGAEKRRVGEQARQYGRTSASA